MTAFDWAQRASVWEYHMASGVNAADPIEAALACRVCLDRHTPALSGPPPALRPQPRRERTEYRDDQADGAQ
jgi:hypothetical protein